MHPRKNSGLKKAAWTKSNFDQASRLRVQPQAGQGTPVSVRSQQGGKGHRKSEASRAYTPKPTPQRKSQAGVRVVEDNGGG